MSSESDDSNVFADCDRFIAERASLELSARIQNEENPPLSVVYCAGSPIDRDQSLEELRLYVENLEPEKTKKQGFFMGFLTKSQAEKQVTQRGQFATYYHLPDTFDSSAIPNDSNISLQLTIVYLDCHHLFRHFPIQKVTSSSKIFFQLANSDASKSSSEPVFYTIKNLIKHYTQFGYVEGFDLDGGVNIEIFPK